MNKVGVIRPSAERRYDVREACLPAGIPDGQRLRGGSRCALLRRSLCLWRGSLLGEHEKGMRKVFQQLVDLGALSVSIAGGPRAALASTGDTRS
jgi:hypothetical protein